MLINHTSIPSSLETGIIGIMHLKRYWAIAMAKRNRDVSAESYLEEWEIDNYLLNTLGLGLEQTIKQLFLEKQNFEEFEEWVLQVNGGAIDREKINRFNALLQYQQVSTALKADEEPVLSEADLTFWEHNGYVIVRDAVSKENCQKTVELICSFLQVDMDNPATWYQTHSRKEGIMVQLFQHPILESNRRSAKIRKAYEQLWYRKDILVNTDKVGFNPPESSTWKFPGSSLHWDVSLKWPIPFGTQGLLYLTDTAANQGAFTVVPGFHHKIEEWLKELPVGTDPRNENLYEFDVKEIAGNAGDFIIWQHTLPHAASANKATKPRFVQYLNYAPVITSFQTSWE